MIMDYKIEFPYEWKEICYYDATSWCIANYKSTEFRIHYSDNNRYVIRYHFAKKQAYQNFKKIWKDPMDKFLYKVIHNYTECNSYYDKRTWIAKNIGVLGRDWRAIVSTKGVEFFFKKQEDCTLFVLTHN